MDIYTDKNGRNFIIISEKDKLDLVSGKDNQNCKLIRMHLVMARKNKIMGIIYPKTEPHQLPIWFYFLAPTKSISVIETEQKQQIIIGLFKWYK